MRQVNKHAPEEGTSEERGRDCGFLQQIIKGSVKFKIQASHRYRERERNTNARLNTEFKHRLAGLVRSRGRQDRGLALLRAVHFSG